MLCTYCVSRDFAAPSESLLLDHIRLVHSQDPDFIIQCSHSGCARSFRNFRTYQNHKLSHGQSISNVEGLVSHVRPSENVVVETDDRGPADEQGQADDTEMDAAVDRVIAASAGIDDIDPNNIQQYVAKWILKTRECRTLSRTAMQGIIEDTTNLLDFLSLSIKSQVYPKLSALDVDSSQFDFIFENCGQKFFDGLGTYHQQMKFYEEKFGFVVRSSCQS